MAESQLIAAWLRGCAEYQLEQIAGSTDEVGWSTLSVTVQELMPGDLMQALTEIVKEHGVRERMRRLGLAYQ